MSLERESRERDCGWERVRNRRERRERARERTTEGPGLNIDRKWEGHQHSYQRANWREHKDVTSFYFTRFPKDTTEKDLWYHLKQVGDVRENFISPKRNRNGRRYGFVRFKGVEDVHQMEKKLDSMVFGGLKMYVNTPKFGRTHRVNSQSVVRGRMEGQHHTEGTRDMYLGMKQAANVKFPQGSYAEAVRRHTPRTEQRRTQAKENSRCCISTPSVSLEIPATGKQWLKGAWVGRLKNLALFDSLEDEMLWDIEETISPRYIGDDMVLLLGLTERKAQKVMEEEDAGWSDLFYSLEKWTPQLRLGYRLTWVQCWGIPLIAWDTQHIKQIVSSIGDMVDVDDDVEELRKLDRARILIKTPWKPFIQHTVNVQIRGELYVVHIVEESGKACANCQRRRCNGQSSSEEIQSEESDAGTLLGDVPPPWWNKPRLLDRTGVCSEPSEDAPKSGEGKDEESLPEAKGPCRSTGASLPRLVEVQGGATRKELAKSQTRRDDTMQDPPEYQTGNADEEQVPTGHGMAENQVDGGGPVSDGVDSVQGLGGLCFGPDPAGKAIDRWIIGLADTVQPSAAEVQMQRWGEGATTKSAMHQIGEIFYYGRCASDEIRESNHESGKMEAEMNVEELGSFKYGRQKARDKEVESLVDLGCDIYTPPKTFAPQKASPKGHTPCPNNSWLVYSRKGGGKKKLAQKCEALFSRDDTNTAETPSIISQQQKEETNKGNHLSKLSQQHQLTTQSRSDGENQKTANNQDA